MHIVTKIKDQKQNWVSKTTLNGQKEGVVNSQHEELCWSVALYAWTMSNTDIKISKTTKVINSEVSK